MLKQPLVFSFFRQITKYTLFCFCIEYVYVLRGLFLHTDPSLRPYSHQLLYICECVVVVVEEAGEDGLGGREYVEEGSSLTNVPPPLLPGVLGLT